MHAMQLRSVPPTKLQATDDVDIRVTQRRTVRTADVMEPSSGTSVAVIDAALVTRVGHAPDALRER